MFFQALHPLVIDIVSDNSLSVDERLTSLCELLRTHIPHYDWVGFYFRNGEREELKLRAFAGEPTEHTVIPFGKGICGQVALSNRNFLVPDVSAQDNYIACSLHVKAELVVPLFVGGENVGQIDIDSHTLNSFSEADERFLEFVNRRVAAIL